MDEIIRAKSLKPLAAAKELKKKYRDDYGHLEAKSLSNRYSELKRQKGMSLASSPTEYRNAVGRELRILRAGIRKLRSDPRAGGKQNRDTQNKKRPRKAELETLIFWKKYYVSAPLSAWLIVLLSSLEQLYSWFIAQRPPRDPAAVSATGGSCARVLNRCTTQ
jgi:hypothetical protein